MNTLIADSPQADFHSYRYLRNTARRLEHLATLGLPFDGRRVLEVGAGIGDLTTFFLDRGAVVHATEGRPENYAVLADRYADDPNVTTELLDLDPPPVFSPDPFDTIVCYGLLYHLSDPALALDYLASACTDWMLLETICDPGTDVQIKTWAEDAELAGAAVTGVGTRPTRRWVFEQLESRFDHVYMPVTQPSHIEFPTDWGASSHPASTRAIFLGSRTPIKNTLLVDHIPDSQQAV